MLVITRREGEEVVIGDPRNPIGVVRIASIKGERVRVEALALAFYALLAARYARGLHELTVLSTVCLARGLYAVPRERIAVTYYAGGHMVYADADARRKFADDIRMFTSGRAPDGGYPSVVPARRSTAPRTAP